MSQPAISSTSAVQQTSSAPSRDRLVIAIDYGTIDTAVAFGLTQTDIANLDELEVVEKWPAGLSSRVPSAISYSPTADMSQQQWGFSVSEDAIVYTRTKLDLDISSKEHMLGRISDFLDGASDLRFEAVLRARGYPEHSWKDAQDMVSDYFRQVFHVVFEELAYMGGHLAQVAVDIVITTPAQQWSYKGENSLFRAVREAGFNNESFPSLGDTIIVAESDAAAIWSIRNMREQQGNESFKQGECFIFCDCGYDIVESTTYRIKCLEPTLQIEAINELKITQGGGKHIYQNFEKWLQGVIGERCFRRLDPRYDQCFRAKETWPKGMRQLAERFDQKLRCRPSDDKTFHIDLPPPLHHLSCADNVVAGELKITSKELKSFMNSWVTSIINLIEGQIQQTNEGNDRITNILLVGDYSDVLHLQNEIDLVMRSKNIKLHRPWLRWGHTATAQGAVVYGIEKSHRSDLCIAESSPRHYGLLLDDGPVVNTTPVHRAGIAKYANDDLDGKWDGKHMSMPRSYEKISAVQVDLSLFPTNDFQLVEVAEGEGAHYLAYCVCKVSVLSSTLSIEVTCNEVRLCRKVIPIPRFYEDILIVAPPSVLGKPGKDHPLLSERSWLADLTSANILEKVHSLIRRKNELDMEIWSLKAVRRVDKPIVEEKMKTADEAFREILEIMEGWEHTELFWSPTEWEMVKDLRSRLLADGKRWWVGNPPWDHL